MGFAIALGIALGAGIGAALGAAFGNAALGVAIGTGIGISFALAFEALKRVGRHRKATPSIGDLRANETQSSRSCDCRVAPHPRVDHFSL